MSSKVNCKVKEEQGRKKEDYHIHVNYAKFIQREVEVCLLTVILL